MEILVIGHGRYAEGIQSVSEIILGDLKHVTFMNTYVDDIDFKSELKKYFFQHQTVLALTDLFGGSVNQEVMQYIKTNELKVITGINVALALEILMMHENVDFSQIKEVIENAKKQIIYVNELFEDSEF